MNGRHPVGVLHSFSIKNIFYDKMDLRLFYFHVMIYGLGDTRRVVFDPPVTTETKNGPYRIGLIVTRTNEV